MIQKLFDNIKIEGKAIKNLSTGATFTAPSEVVNVQIERMGNAPRRKGEQHSTHILTVNCLNEQVLLYYNDLAPYPERGGMYDFDDDGSPILFEI